MPIPRIIENTFTYQYMNKYLGNYTITLDLNKEPNTGESDAEIQEDQRDYPSSSNGS